MESSKSGVSVVCVCCVAILALLQCAGCGPSEQEVAEKEVGKIVERFYQAMSDVDLDELEELVVGSVADRVEDAADDPVLQAIMQGYREYEIEIDDVDVFEDDASVDLYIEREPARLPQSIELESDDGEWKIGGLEYDLPTLDNGYEFLVDVRVEDAVDAEAEEALARLLDELDAMGVSVSGYRVSLSGDEAGLPTAELTFLSVDGIEVAQDLLDEQFAQWSHEGTGSLTLKVSLKTSAVAEISIAAVEQMKVALRTRVCDLGLPIPGVVIEGDPQISRRIRIHLPGVFNIDELKSYLFRVGRFGFQMVVEGPGGRPVEATSGEEILAIAGGPLPEGSEISKEYSRSIAPRTSPLRWYLLHKDTPVSGQHLVNSKVINDDYGNPAISFSLNEEGADRLRRLTRANMHKMMAIVLDGEVLMAAQIQTELGADCQITGQFELDEARIIANLLKSQALPAGVDIVEERQFPSELEW